ncbi:FAD-dependent thymidylate synthase [Acutalibacter caecimuris]|uniref:FAD-dependent thymidylate synthase n=1 Tax=Acutalibacter caecimuris TaxID=3093657 RepID=UPI002AC9A37F|nr:FAD-dependent thymidylate synthase [Acutalibacter sp. M00118]
MKSLHVKLLACTPDPERTVACAAKLCYAAADIDTVYQGLTEEKTGAFIDMLTEIGHESPLEHASFTFGIEGVSRSLLAQLTRHRIASYSVQSQRYVKEGRFDYVLPPEIEALPQAKEEFLAAMEEDVRHYQRLADILQKEHEQAFLAQGLTPKEAARKAEKKAIEDARFVLPNACATKLICTMNARELRNFFTHRCCKRAQWEIRALATEMLRLVRETAPHLFRQAGPPCLRGECPEGKMSCGQATAVREQFAGLGASL